MHRKAKKKKKNKEYITLHYRLKINMDIENFNNIADQFDLIFPGIHPTIKYTIFSGAQGTVRIDHPKESIKSLPALIRVWKSHKNNIFI